MNMDVYIFLRFIVIFSEFFSFLCSVLRVSPDTDPSQCPPSRRPRPRLWTIFSILVRHAIKSETNPPWPADNIPKSEHGALAWKQLTCTANLVFVPACSNVCVPLILLICHVSYQNKLWEWQDSSWSGDCMLGPSASCARYSVVRTKLMSTDLNLFLIIMWRLAFLFLATSSVSRQASAVVEHGDDESWLALQDGAADGEFQQSRFKALGLGLIYIYVVHDNKFLVLCCFHEWTHSEINCLLDKNNCNIFSFTENI